MPYVLGLDISLTSTGLAMVQVDKTGWSAECGCVTSKPGTDRTYEAISKRVHIITETLDPFIARADLIVVEGPSLASVHGYIHTRAWLWGKIFDRCLELGKRTLVLTPAQRCRYATGKGNAHKDAVLAAAIKRWPGVDITSNDEADALILAAIGCRYIDLPIDTVPKTRWEPIMDNLHSIAIPKPRHRGIVDVHLPS